jgi:NAD-dependent dihydropyrimidine dehydrogenase PreA subunit
MSVFIHIDILADALPFELAEQIVSLCPVEIFALQEQKLQVQEEREDECTLCDLCLNAAPAGALVIRKLYKDEKLVSRGTHE